ncbi:carboxypeptidase-like regulatory domain-containing protein [Chryseosolibacter indicus]|uniref:Carboxypeptidase-like regulatory domain-containing protein n=1 Tax=Chryseosolibacter indicus TaxID=2782351 RepID=A0ABS5W018_9BACT|nr:carboxypeptidase-like regulatory domain-containing protein [Chryseosolibacter indicus]MBT1706514.1 carboxypeptidase-like regulatory domain-containing protein [Chryseosolibacter indicus]
MNKSISLSIPRPCSEQWDKFTSTPTGGFCSSCSKVVIDFTKMNDSEIVEYFSTEHASTCGRFRPGQLKEYVFATLPPTITPGYTVLKAGILGLLFLLVSKPSLAQTHPTKPITELDVHTKQVQSVDLKKQTKTVRGVVKGDDGMPLPGANVLLKGTTEGVTCDVDGRFEFPKKLEEGDVLVASFIGFTYEEYTIRNTSLEDIEITLTLEAELMGELAVHTAYEHEESRIRKWWGKVKGLF